MEGLKKLLKQKHCQEDLILRQCLAEIEKRGGNFQAN